MNKTRTLVVATLLLAFGSAPAWAQARRISGVVTSEGGEPLPQATVNVLGTALGGYTTESGHFTIPAPEGTVTLRVRRIGYREKTVTVNAGAADVVVKLSKDVLQLEKQVITGTATSVSSQNSANAVAVVTADQLNRAPTPTIENALQGKIAGAIITTNSGAPGGGVQVQLRGTTSIGSSSSPLYVVDGVIVSNDAISSGLTTITQASRVIGTSTQDQQVNRIADLNPADIEDISVLKGASAGAFYGSAASNGVIIITTKRGRQGKPAFNITQRLGQFRLSNKLNLRCFTSAEEAADAGLDATEWQPVCNDFQEQFYGAKDLSYETDLSMSGGNAGTTYFASGLVKRDAGIEKGTGYNKQSLRVNIGQLIGTKLNLKANTELIHSLTVRGVSGNDNANVNPFTVFSATPTFFSFLPVDGVYPRNPYLGANGDNPFQDREFLKTPENIYRFIGGATANYNLLSSVRQTLDVVANGGIDHFTQIDKLVSPRFLYFEPADGLPGTVVDNNSNSVIATLGASIIHRFFPASQLFAATSSVGLRQGRKQFDQVFTAGQNLLLGQDNLDKATNLTATETRTLVKDFSYYAQEELLLFNERLNLTAGVNLERTSNNGDPDKYYKYPKYAAAYRSQWLPPYTNDLKFRIAYGRAGNKPAYGQKFTSLVVVAEDGVSGTRPALAYGNTEIKPERSTETEGGVDATLFNGRASFEFTAYRKNIDDLILTAIRAPTTGFTSQVINGGSIINRGYEISLNATPLQWGDLSWISRTTFAHNHAIVTQLPVPAFNTGGFGIGFGATRIQVGASPTAIIGRNGRDTTWNRSGTVVHRGDAGCLPTNTPAECGTFVSRVDHLDIIGDQNPRFTMGFSNEVNYGPLRLTSLLDWRHGGNIANLTNDYLLDCCSDNQGTMGDTALVTKLRHLQVDLRSTKAWLEDASFLKLRELSLSYALPASLTSRMFSSANGVRLEVSGRNLYTWTPYTGLDPEVSNFGNSITNRFSDVTPYPPSRSWFFSVSADF
ncbi:MAG TPA: SusC/RagA family TonB-linked outer membrane protein [Gemmatimonadaceae bacterium]|nr:SusC/RagA family TonB-linked outer membrane protein [Gemmatimonadaceae bacterium]